MGTPEKKRRLTEDSGETSSPIVAPSRPPLKKRFTSSVNIQQPVLIPEPEPMPPPKSVKVEFPIDLDLYSKEDLLQHMRTSKEEALYYEKRSNTLNEKLLDKETRQSLFRIDWCLIQSQVKFISTLLVSADLPDHPALSFRKLTVEQQREWNNNSQLAIKQLCVKAFSRLEQWTTLIDNLEKKFKSQDDQLVRRTLVSDWLQTEMKDLTTSYEQGQRLLNELQKSFDSLSEQTSLVKNNLRMATPELEHLKEKLERSIEDLSLACKRQDRSQSKLVAALNFGGLGDMPDPNKEEAIATPSEDEPEKEVKAESVQTKENGSMTEQVIKTQLEEHKLILTTREKEIDELKRDRQLLLRDEERLLSMFTMGEERLSETEYVKVLQLSIEHYRDRCHHLEQKRVDIEREMDKVSAMRQQLMEQVKSEKVSQGMALEAEMRRLESDLNRIRGQRDGLQGLVEEQTNKDLREKEARDKIISFANQGKLRISALETRITKLKADQEMAGPFAKEASTFKSLKDSINQLQTVLKSLEMIEKKSARPLQPQNLDQNYKKWKSDPDVILCDQQLEESQKSALMIEFLEKNEGHLLEEIDRVAGIYGRLEEQQGKKIFDLTPKRDQILKLQAEKLKYAQTFPSLNAAKEQQITIVNEKRKETEKQNGMIKQLKEKEKTLESQVLEKESMIRKVQRDIEEDKTDLEDINHLCEDYRISIDQNEIFINELQKMLKEKSKLLEEEKHLQDEIEDSYEKMKKKWDKITQGDNPAEQQLVEECEELRALLKCSTCRTRFRTHILTRCMHTFCKNCIDARLETRQRRCPTCSEPFGANDVKNFYL